MRTRVDQLDHSLDNPVDTDAGRVELDRSVGYL
jgi:hypothetical protein